MIFSPSLLCRNVWKKRWFQYDFPKLHFFSDFRAHCAMHFIFFFLLWFIFSGTFYSYTKIFCMRNAILGKHFFSLQTNSTKKIIDQNVCCCNKPFVSWYFICKWPPFPHRVNLDIKSAISNIESSQHILVWLFWLTNTSGFSRFWVR